MKEKICTLVVLLCAFWLVGCANTGGGGTPEGGDVVGPDYRNSRAEVVVLSFFDMYCPVCQRSADEVNELYGMARKQGGRIAFYAIGKNNTPMEADTYRKRFNVPFPVVADRQLTVASRFGSFKAPMVIALRRQGGDWKEFYRANPHETKVDEMYARIQP
ncbi:peroxiredoxin family protein [Sulfuriroseicoccus oceanibius]|uniref:TlpA family protein disulfide reductase n=1 Tax=Sulfuriroseicoccus oceanibius TaxID=2707525 RepID=A0A6B3L3J0_9BACT|nr:TlpA disulfide reductase family protein [Sulfuriroseicoccus oceanibius]QQL45644.1 TlpA family protein disulfide reductase [Sulfuriroseicoccus oceanibius]